jgi:hypothetical protein
VFRLIPATRSFLTILPLADKTARCNGVIPYILSCISNFTPQEINADTQFYYPA